jgi:hypothetical protein
MLNGVFDSMRAIADSMCNQIENLQRMQNLASVDAMFKSMPSTPSHLKCEIGPRQSESFRCGPISHFKCDILLNYYSYEFI